MKNTIPCNMITGTRWIKLSQTRSTIINISQIINNNNKLPITHTCTQTHTLPWNPKQKNLTS